MYRTSTALVLLVLPVSAQFADLVTTDNGEQVYFTTQFRLRTTPSSNRSGPSAFRITGGLLEPFTGAGEGVSSLQVTGDGQSVALLVTNRCQPGVQCQSVQAAEVRGVNAQVLGSGTVWMSRNGRWAIVNPPPLRFPTSRGEPPVPSTEADLIDLVTGARITIPLPATRGGSPLASDGTVFVQRQSAAGPGFTLGLGEPASSGRLLLLKACSPRWR